jgi:hypothetical protein
MSSVFYMGLLSLIRDKLKVHGVMTVLYCELSSMKT